MSNLIALCSTALSSPRVGRIFPMSVCNIVCGSPPASVHVSADAGVVPALIATLREHGEHDTDAATMGCAALLMLIDSSHDPVIAGSIMFTGGLDAICTVLAAHPDVEAVQSEGALALLLLVDNCPLEALGVVRASRVVGLLQAARTAFPAEGEYTIKCMADQVLSKLRLY